MTTAPTGGSTAIVEPGRFSGSRRPWPTVLLAAAAVPLGALLIAIPFGAQGVALPAALSGVWLLLVLVMMLPRESERAGRELARRLAQYRHELNGLGDTPAADALEQMIRRARELGLRDEEVAEDLAELRACADGLALQAQILRGELPIADAPDPLPAGDVCHFVCPVRSGRRRADQVGNLVLTTGWLKFRGPLDVSVAWSEVASITRDRCDIIVRLQDSRRLMRLSCHTPAEAVRGAVIAGHLAHAARMDARPAPAGGHAVL